ncbi:MAG: hypothetical protein J1F68_01030 [Clostridiales bacterium]|nr:hypothetical protein [Clostridiales bacterium]
MFIFKNKTPQERIRIADKNIQRLRSKRSNVSEFYEPSKYWQINQEIHRNKVEIDIAKVEMRQPVSKTTNITTYISLNKTNKSKSIQFHGHYHNNKKKNIVGSRSGR